MMLANPWALLWLAVGLPVAALFFFRVRPTEIIVPALALWEQLNRAREYQGFGKRFGRWPTLLAQLVIVALLTLTLSDPRLAGDRRDVVVVLDDSATMQTRDESGRTRFDLARDEVLRLVREADADGVVAVVLAGEPVRVAAHRNSDGSALRAIVAGLAPRDVNADLTRALRLAANIASDAGSGRVIVYSDKPLPSSASKNSVRWSRVGKPQPNVGIAAIRKSTDERELIVTVHQNGMDGRPAAVRLVVDDREIDRKEFTLIGQSAEISLSGPDGANQAFEVHCEPTDGLPLDNVAYGVWTAPKPARVLLVSPGNLPLLAALSQPGLTVDTINFADWRGDESADVVVLDRPTAPAVARSGARYFVVGGNDPFGWCRATTSQPAQQPVQWAPDHPALRDVDLFNWRIRNTNGMSACSASTAIVSGAQSSLVLESGLTPAQGEDTSGSPVAILVNFDLDHSNVLALASFPIFVWNSVQYLLGRSVDCAEVAFATGSPASVPTESTQPVRVINPRGEPVEAVAESNALLFLQPERAGIYRIETADVTRPVAFNWVPADSSRVDASGAAAAPAPTTRSPSWLRPLWSRLLMLGVGLIFVELILFHLNILRLG